MRLRSRYQLGTLVLRLIRFAAARSEKERGPGPRQERHFWVRCRGVDTPVVHADLDPARLVTASTRLERVRAASIFPISATGVPTPVDVSA
jgi:hypothetical protein